MKDETIYKNVHKFFGIQIRNLKIIHLRTRKLIEAENYKFLTILLQNVGQYIMGIECAFRLMP